MNLRPESGVVGGDALDPVSEGFDLALVGERAPECGRATEDLGGVEAAGLDAVEFASQVEGVVVAMV